MDIDFEVNWPLIIQTLVATVLPLVVGLVTTRVTRSGIKASLLALLAVITSGLTEVLTAMTGEETFDLGIWLVGAVGSFAVAVSAHYGFWRPVGATEAVQSVGSKGVT